MKGRRRRGGQGERTISNTCSCTICSTSAVVSLVGSPVSPATNIIYCDSGVSKEIWTSITLAKVRSISEVMLLNDYPSKSRGKLISTQGVSVLSVPQAGQKSGSSKQSALLLDMLISRR